MPIVFDVTSVVTVQLAKAGIRPSVKLIAVPPSIAVSMPSVQLVTAFAGVARVTPAGRLSVKARSVAGVASLVIVKVSLDILPGPIESGEKFLEKLGAA